MQFYYTPWRKEKHIYTDFVTCATVQHLEQMLCPVFFCSRCWTDCTGAQQLSLHSLCVYTTGLFSLLTPCLWLVCPIHTADHSGGTTLSTSPAAILHLLQMHFLLQFIDDHFRGNGIRTLTGDSASQQDAPSKLTNLWMNLAILEWRVPPNCQHTTCPTMVSIAVKTKHGAICTVNEVSDSTWHVWVVQVICNTPQHTGLTFSTETALCVMCRSGQPPAELP